MSTIITMPDTLAVARGCTLELVSSDAATRSDPAGTLQARSYGVPVWSLLLVSPEALTDPQAGAWKALGLGLRGLVNHLAAYDPSRPVPLGSVRGVLTLSASAAAGAAALAVSAGAGQAGRDLLPGDLLQVGTGLRSSELVMVMSRAVVAGDGALALTTEPPLRRAYPAGTVLTWERPRVYMRRTEARFGWGALTRRISAGMRLQLIEQP